MAGNAPDMRPPEGRSPLRGMPEPSIGFEPPIRVCGLQTEPTTLMKFSPAGLVMTCEVVVPDVGKGIVMTGRP